MPRVKTDWGRATRFRYGGILPGMLVLIGYVAKRFTVAAGGRRASKFPGVEEICSVFGNDTSQSYGVTA